MRLNRKLVTNALLIAMALAAVVGVQVLRGTTVEAAPAPKVVICHAAGPPPTQYIRIVVSSNAIGDSGKGTGGHINEDSKPNPGHAHDIIDPPGGVCPGDPEPSPSPSPTPSPSPSPSS
jgi:hypothetical protein